MHLLILIFCFVTSSLWGAEGEGRYIVKFKDTSKADLDFERLGRKPERKLDDRNSRAVKLDDDSFEQLLNNPNVTSIEIDHPRIPFALESIPWGITKVQADDPIFSGVTASEGVTVCIIDSGYQASHEDLQDISSGLLTGSTDPVSGNWYEDTCGHGSHVAGTISALKNNIGLVGVNSNGKLRLHIEKVFNGSSCGLSYSSDLVAAVDRCLASVRGTGRKLVINMSLGGATPTALEQDIINTAQAEGALVVAAAGNAGNTELNYPAGYNSVVSVGAVDKLGQKAYFSQINNDVELSAPGVDVISTTPFKPQSVSVGLNQWAVRDIVGSAKVNVTAPLSNGDLCLTSNSSWSGKIVICERGTLSFAEKANNVTASGGVGVIIYNNISSIFDGELTPSTSKIPVVSMSREDGLIAINYINEVATLLNSSTISGFGNGYQSYDGTSMATPHVSGVAALVWSFNLTKSNSALRSALQVSALDMGNPGRDPSYGFGIVQAKAAHEALKLITDTPTVTGATLSASLPSMSFGPINVGLTQTKTLNLTNIHSKPLSISNISIFSDTANPYSYTHNCPAEIAPATGCTLTLNFSPLAAQNFTASLSISPSIGDILFVSLSGVSQSATPSFQISSTSFAFGNQAINNTSPSQSLVVTNTGGTVLNLPAAWLSFSTAGQFSQTQNCSTSLAIGASCTINISFKPTTIGAKSSTLRLTPTGLTAQSVTLSGSGVTPSLTLTPTSLAFGTVKSNTVSPAKTVTIKNGTVTLYSYAISFTGTASTQFKQTNNCPIPLASGASCTVSIVFAPTSTGSKSATLNVAPTGGTAKTVKISGTGN